MDGFSFVILILQKRLYMSRMFEHVVNELKIQSRLAARYENYLKLFEIIF